jgi:glycosyltransferase involved in cell wall biosynthesis
LNFTIESFLPNPWSLINPGDVVVVPSLWEGDGLVVLEALHLGVPILVSDIKDLRRLKLPEKNYFHDLTSCEDQIRTNIFCATNLSVPPESASGILESRSPQHIYNLWATCLADA